jgi:hypothetical protein
MNRHELKPLILEQLDPEELVDILHLGTEQLMYHLNDVVEEAISNGVFDYLLLMDEDDEEGEQT